MREFAFELALCAAIEDGERLVARQLGTGVHGRRVMDVVCVEPGPTFADRAAITAETIPDPAIESDVGPGQATFWKDAFDCHPKTARDAIERAAEIGFFERERRGGRSYLRQAARYPDDWYDRLVGIENKPDLGTPGDLESQLRRDVELGVLDEVILATASHVTGAHRNRIPEEVGIWEFDPETGQRTVLREAEQLPTTEPGVDVLAQDPARTDVRIATAAEKARQRRRVAERAYGKGWRTYGFPDCGQIAPDDRGLPVCPWAGGVVRPSVDCGADCPGHDPGAAPDVDVSALRESGTPWVASPDGRSRSQSGLDRYS